MAMVHYCLDTTQLHNGKYVLWAQGCFLYHGCYPGSNPDIGVPVGDRACFEFSVNNLLIDELSTPKLLKWNGQPGTVLPIQATLTDNVSRGSRLTAEVYSVDAADVAEWPLRTVSGMGTSLQWDGTDDSGAPVDAGIYVYKLKAAHIEPTWEETPMCSGTLVKHDWDPDPDCYQFPNPYIIDSDTKHSSHLSVAVGDVEVADFDPITGARTFRVAYKLSDDVTTEASECKLHVYDSDYEEVAVQDVSATVTQDWQHALVSLPDTPDLERYTFVISAVDSYPPVNQPDAWDKAHRLKPALEYGVVVPEVKILDMDQPIGGRYPVRVAVRARQGEVTSIVLKEHEVTDLHSWQWQEFGSITNLTVPESVVFDENGVPTTTYLIKWDTTQVRNGVHHLRVEANFRKTGLVTGQYVETDVNVLNLVVAEVTPPDHITWDGENPPQPITVHLEDNDLTDPTEVTLTLYDCGDEYPGAGVRTISPTSGGGGTYTFAWDGAIDEIGTPAEPGAYTYEVNVTQSDTNGPGLDVQDTTEYRSTYLHLNRTMDEFFQPICDVEVYDYDDKGTPEEDDDDIIYLVRYYSLTDDGNKNASEGKLKLYDPDMQKLNEWDVLTLQDLAATNGLVAGTTAVEHKLLVPLSASMMEAAGDYRFVLHIADDHAAEYRDHRYKRPALDLNAKARIIGVAAIAVNDGWRDGGSERSHKAHKAYGLLNRVGYGKWIGKPNAGDPHDGASGLLVDIDSHAAVHTLGLVCSQPGCSTPPYRTSKNAVFAFYGHGKVAPGNAGGALSFALDRNGSDYWSRITNYVSDADNYDIRQWTIDEVRLAYLDACHTGGSNCTTYDPETKQVRVYNLSRGNSIGQAFYSQGADAVVAFKSFTWSGTTYDLFNEAFFRAVCKKGATVGNAVEAARASVERFIGNNSWAAKFRPTPVVWGRGTTLVPARYGQ